ncbi:MAG TPA: alpha/beta fold hydrolase, partial [Longimicrobiales bacterium]|nr:alpha/beta fold hydrolase [Longimicrobiales bacterium]
MTTGGGAEGPGHGESPVAGLGDLPLHVAARGRGPPILLLHGYAASAHSFRHWVPELALDHQAIPVDLKGFGAAPGPDDGRYSPVDLAGPVVELIRRLDLRDLTLVGHSLGGGLALVAALGLLDRGELDRLRGLVSVSGAAYAQPLPPFARLARWPRASRVGLALVPKGWLVRRVLVSIVHDPGSVDREQVEGYAAPLRNPESHRPLLEAARQIVPPELPALTARYPEL